MVLRKLESITKVINNHADNDVDTMTIVLYYYTANKIDNINYNTIDTIIGNTKYNTICGVYLYIYISLYITEHIILKLTICFVLEKKPKNPINISEIVSVFVFLLFLGYLYLKYKNI